MLLQPQDHERGRLSFRESLLYLIYTLLSGRFRRILHALEMGGHFAVRLSAPAA